MDRAKLAAISLSPLLATLLFAADASKTGWRDVLHATKQPQMALPSELLSDVDVVKFSGRRTPRSPLEFAPYSVERLQRSVLRTQSKRTPGIGITRSGHLHYDSEFESVERRQNYSFHVAEQGVDIWNVRCEWRGFVGNDVVREGSDGAKERFTGRESEVGCTLSRPDSVETARLQASTVVSPKPKRQGWLGPPRPEDYATETASKGRLIDGDRQYEVLTSYQLKGLDVTGDSPAGYLFTRSDGAVAAADTLPRKDAPGGRLLLRASLSSNDRSLMAAAAAALILQPGGKLLDDF